MTGRLYNRDGCVGPCLWGNYVASDSMTGLSLALMNKSLRVLNIKSVYRHTTIICDLVIVITAPMVNCAAHRVPAQLHCRVLETQASAQYIRQGTTGPHKTKLCNEF